MTELPSIRASTARSSCHRSARARIVAELHLEAAVRLDQDRQLLGQAYAVGAGDDLGRQARSFHDLDRRLPARPERQFDEHLDLGVQLVGGCDHPGRVAGKIIEIAERRLGRLDLQPARPRRVRPSRPPAPPELITLTASADSAGTWRATSPSCRSGTISRPAAAGSSLCRASCPATASATDAAPGPHSVESSTGVSRRFIGTG